MKILPLLLIILFSSKVLFGQEKREFEIQCKNIITIDSLEFEQNRTQPQKINELKCNPKTKQTLTIKTEDSSIVLKDDLSEKGFFEYSFLGKFQENNWILILGQDYNRNYYYLININSNKIDTLIGYPQIFKNEILTIEGEYTDGSALIEIWDFQKNNVKKIKSFSLRECMIYGIRDAYLKDDFLYIRNFYRINKYDYYKIRIE